MIKKPRILDLYCGAGGAAMGYSRAGFDVAGVDIVPQKHYPFEFHQGDALEYAREHGREFDAIHASPPCQKYSVMTRGRWKDRDHVDLIEVTRRLLIDLDRPYVIENVPGAPLLMPIELCGTMFGLQTAAANQLHRHRLFELSTGFILVSPCNHNKRHAIGVYGGGQNPARQNRRPYIDDGAEFGIVARREAMGIDWMTGKELNQAIPPAYTEFIGHQLMDYLEQAVAA